MTQPTSRQQELSKVIVAEIEAEYAAVKQHAAQACADLVDMQNAAVRLGILLATAKATPRGGVSWQMWIAENLSISHAAAVRCMLLAVRANHQPTDCSDTAHAASRDLMRATGHLTAPQGHHSQNRHIPESFYNRVIRHATKLQTECNKELKGRPISEWTQEERDSVYMQLKPTVDLARNLE